MGKKKEPSGQESEPTGSPANANAKALAKASANADTNTDTDTDGPVSPAAPQQENRPSESADETEEKRARELQDASKALIAAASSEEQIDRHVAEVIRYTRAGEEWRPWFKEMLTRASADEDGAISVWEAAQHLEDCSSPETRRAKDLGELKNPLGFMIKAIQSWAKNQSPPQRWPPYPEDGKSKEKPAA